MMNTDYLHYAVILFISGCISLFFILLTWPRRRAPGVLALMVFMGGATIWAWTYSLHWLFPEWPARFFWLDATYLGVVIVPTAMALFAFQVTYLDKWITRKTIALLCVEPILTLIILWTDPWHGLFFAGKRTPSSSDIFEGGLWFWLNIVYVYALILVSVFIIIRGFLRTRGIFRQQYGLILIGACIPPLINLLRFMGVSPFPGMDPTPIMFIFQGLFYTVGIYRFSIFDLVPVAKEALLETMPEGLLVVDDRWRVVEINQSALALLQQDRTTVIGANIVSALRQWPELEALIRRGDRVPISFQVKYQKKFLGVNITPLYNREQQITGRLVTWQDITKQLQIEARLEEANQKLRAQLREIKSLQASLEDQVIRDPLTNLLNRRFLEEALPKEVARAQRKEYPVTILIIDIDEFKLVNDTYGHAAGDLILQNLGRLLSKQTRKDDIAVRLGGEEFLILLTEVGLEQGMKRAEDIRRLIEKMRSEVDEFRVGITVSIGVAEFPSSSKEIRDVMRKADQAMYRAKFKGRNQVAR